MGAREVFMDPPENTSASQGLTQTEIEVLERVGSLSFFSDAFNNRHAAGQQAAARTPGQISPLAPGPPASVTGRSPQDGASVSSQSSQTRVAGSVDSTSASSTSPKLGAIKGQSVTAATESPTLCVICLDEDVHLKMECCRSSYHALCLVKWFVTNPTCPSCRTKLSEDQNYRQSVLRAARQNDESSGNPRGPILVLPNGAAASIFNPFAGGGLIEVFEDEDEDEDEDYSDEEETEDDEDDWTDDDYYDESGEDDDDDEVTDDSDHHSDGESATTDDSFALTQNECQHNVDLSVYQHQRVKPNWYVAVKCPNRRCGRSFNSIHALQDHLRNTSQHTVWTCCGKVFVNSNGLVNHCNAVH
ncbi:hypothetical protein HDU96_003915 [Phlyctochytrium bullatum]|nr:hypothetical protein HDU96_003915 [Phlyctochytrium bullatum]